MVSVCFILSQFKKVSNEEIWIWIWIVYADRTSDWYRVSGTGGAQANPYLGSF